ncbi:MAG: amidohydrolase, partial [Plesiomonas sp.]
MKKIAMLGIIPLSLVSIFAYPATPTADTIFYGGDILTMTGNKPAYVEAVGVKDGKITFVGNMVDAKQMIGKSTVMADLQGKTLLPGFVDGHSHFMMALGMVNQVNVANPPVGPVTDIPSIIETIKEFKQQRKIADDGWIVGWGYDGTQLKEKRELTKADLDAAFPDNKVVLIHVSGHGGVFNSKALEWANITAETPTPAGGVIARMDDGKEPAGLLMETAYIPVFAKLPTPSEPEMLDLLKEAQMSYAANGYTLANEGFTHMKDILFLKKGAEQQRLFIDIAALPAFVDVKEWMDNPDIRFGEWKNRLKMQGMKITQDGSPQGKTAYVTQPFLTGGPDGQKDWRGETTQPYKSFAAMVKNAHSKGLQIFIHANGDATIDQVIKAVEAAGITAKDDVRTIVIHSQFQRPDQLPRYKALGISPSYFTNHTYFWGDVH